MTKDDFIRLYEKNLSGEITPEEKEALEMYRDDFRLEDWDHALHGEKDETGRIIYDRIKAGMTKSPKGRIAGLRRIWLSAAAILLPVILAGIYWWSGRSSHSTAIARTAPSSVRFKNDVHPGGDKAILTLANGAAIALDSAGKGLLAQQGNVRVMKTKDGQLSYIASGARTQVLYNTISTPRGGQFQVLLPDGSRVWLNAASSLRFPTAFTGKERRVELTGEGYFQIAKAPSMPFTVKVDHGLEVEVLGTEFNIMAYGDEAAISTTLVNGAVRLKKADHTWELKPGEQARLANSGQMDLEEDADLDGATAWKNGEFEFNGNIKGIMRQIARWYDVEVRYEGNVSDKAFGGTIARTANVSEALKMLELTGSVHFAIDGKMITVKP